MSLFKKYTEINYIDLLLKFNPSQIDSDYQTVIDTYKTPSREYIKKSARNLSCEEIELETLEYIITTCRECSLKQRYEACIVSLYKIYTEHHSSRDDIEKIKSELKQYLDDSGYIVIEDWAFLSDAVEGCSFSFFYLLEISIGANKIYKYGITHSHPRKRFSQIKSDIHSAYKNHYVQIIPLLLFYIEDLEKYEEEIKTTLLEFGVFNTNYAFKGATETFCESRKQVVLEEIIIPKGSRFNALVIYDKDDITNASDKNTIGFPYCSLAS